MSNPKFLAKTEIYVFMFQVPPRPRRPPGREERGGARAVSRAVVDADRSLRGERGDRDRHETYSSQHPIICLSKFVESSILSPFLRLLKILSK